MVLTKEYLLKRGFCCQSGCQNCPYGVKDRIDPSVPMEFQTCSTEDQTFYEYDDDGDED